MQKEILEFKLTEETKSIHIIFCKHMEFYLDRIRKCNAIIKILNQKTENRDQYRKANLECPVFWSVNRYCLQVCLASIISSLIADNPNSKYYKDEGSLAKFLSYIEEHANELFLDDYYYDYFSRQTKLREDNNRNVEDINLILCELKATMLSVQKECTKVKLNDARNKIFCHMDINYLNNEEMNCMLKGISDETVKKTVCDLSDITTKIYNLYNGMINCAEYANQEDIEYVMSKF